MSFFNLLRPSDPKAMIDLRNHNLNFFKTLSRLSFSAWIQRTTRSTIAQTKLMAMSAENGTNGTKARNPKKNQPSAATAIHRPRCK